MAKDLDILIRHAHLRRSDGLLDIAVKEGTIVEISPVISRSAEVEIDAGGSLVTESFVNPHLHLDKVYTLPMLDEQALRDYHGQDMGKAMTAIELAARVKEGYEEGWILENARRAIGLAAKYGTTHMRAFSDVDNKARLEGIKALIKAREEWRGQVEIQVVAFPQDGVVREPGTTDLIREALELGADVVGGIPWIEYTEAEAQAHVDAMFDLAVEFDKDVSMLVDDAGDPGLRTLEMMAVRAIRSGWRGRSLAHHARAMALYPMPYFQKIVALLKRAGTGLVTDPHTGPLHARVSELLEAGVRVCLGQDDISDAYYPFGRNNMLEVAFLASHLLWMTTTADMERLYDMITIEPARAIGLTKFRLEAGAPANLVVLGAPDVLEALREHAPPRHVVSHGKLLDQVS
ncbi:MAG: cytosine deaminase [Chloroflexi bacterium RBG_19FT_COMBO_62_14]|nr:MAG: cytosine deaminase [Chloroflexi bacterium RBG_19FT_COMBO_62_14]